MLDYNCNPPQNPTIDWKNQLRWGDIVLFRFPGIPGKSQRPPEPCPCVIHSVTNIAGTRFVTLILGTKAKQNRQKTQGTQITGPKALEAAGLAIPTRFDGIHRITVSLDNPGFVCGDNISPIVGCLVGQVRKRFSFHRARLQASIDLAASRRNVLRQKQVCQKWPAARNVIVPRRKLRGRIPPIHLA